MAGPMREESFEVGGRRLAWLATGEGPPLVLVNGYAARAADWDPTFLDGLARSFEVICPDNRGFGDSDLGDTNEFGIEAMAADIDALMGHREIDSAPVVGWSMGGFIAQRLALRSPERVGSLILLATDAGGSDVPTADEATWAKLTDHSGSPREQASRIISLLFPDSLAPEIDRQFGDLVAEARAEIDEPALFAQERAMAEWHEGTGPERVLDAPPTLIVVGDEDVVIPAANAEALRACWPGAWVEVFTGAAHAVMAQEPERLSDLITRFAAKAPEN